MPVPPREIPEAPVGVSTPSDLTSKVNPELSEISQMHQHIIGVEYELGIDAGVYSISFASEGEDFDTRLFELTSGLLQISRGGLVEGVPLQSTKNPGFHFA
ncbi:MAG: hypothetical protein ACFFEA_13880 [Candidatus Thorarchaeota archaeon]